jgi:outer membrane protein assembly factor BamB
MSERPSRRQFLAAGLAALAAPALLAAPVAEYPKVLWTLDLKSPSYGGGALGDLRGDGVPVWVFGTYFNDEHLYAVRAADGAVLWQFKSERGPFDAGVALADVDGDGKLEVLAADSSTGTLFCLDGAGKPKWTFRLPNSTDSPPAVADIDGDGNPEIVVGTMSLGDKHGRVVCLDPATRTAKWVAKVPGHVQSEPALVPLRGKGLDVVVTTWRGDKAVHALSGTDGSSLWSHAMAGDMYHGVSAFDRGGIKVAAGDVCLLDGAGKELWTRNPGGYLFGPTAVADLDGDGSPEIVVAGGRLTVFAADGTEKWRTPEHGGIPRGAAVAEIDGKPALLFGASDRKFRAIRGDTGAELWAHDATVKGHVYEGIDSGPLVADVDGDGLLEAFFVLGKGTSDKTRGENYGRAVAVKVGKGTGRWDTFRGGLRRTGLRLN